MGFEIIEAGHLTSTILVRFPQFPRALEMTVLNKDMEGLQLAVNPYLPVKETLPGGGVITRVLKPARPARWRFESLNVYAEEDAELLKNSAGMTCVFEPELPERTVWNAHGRECTTREEAISRVKRTSAVNQLVRTEW